MFLRFLGLEKGNFLADKLKNGHGGENLKILVS